MFELSLLEICQEGGLEKAETKDSIVITQEITIILESRAKIMFSKLFCFLVFLKFQVIQELAAEEPFCQNC